MTETATDPIRHATRGDLVGALAAAREREATAEKRAAGLAAVNNVLKRSLVRLTSHDDLGLFLGAVLLEAVDTAGAVSGAVFLHDPDSDTIRAEAALLHGELIDTADPRWEAFREPTPAGTGRAWQIMGHERRPYWVDYGGPPDPDDWPQSHAWHNAHGHRFVGCMPMLLGDDVIGFLGLAFDKSVVVPPSPERLEICHSLAQHATLAVRLTRLAEEARRSAVAREREIAAERRAADLADTNAALKLTLDATLFDPNLDAVLGQVLVAITRHLRSPASAVWLADGDTGRHAVRLVYHEGRVVEMTRQTEGVLKGAWGRGRDLYFKDHLRLRKPVVYQVDELLGADPRAGEFFRRLGFHTLLGIPLLLGEEVAGSLTVRFDTRRDLRAEDLELAQAMAHQATMAIQLTRLAERAGQAAVLGERTRLAREIHDTVAQGLVGILMHTRAAVSGDNPAHHLAVTQQLAEENLAETRRAVQALRPTVAGSDGLVGSLRRFAERLTETGGVPIRVRTPDRPPVVPSNVEDELGRIAQEAAANAVKHSGADEVVVELLADGPGLRLTITDSGRGFDTDRIPDGRYGIVGMIERAERVAAALTIISEPGRGTTVVVAWQPGWGTRGAS